jgi:sec-independent protein translocase protein TatA
MNLLNSNALLAFGLPGGWEWIILLVIGLLLFGRRLPEVGRSIGQGIKEFKKGLKDVEEDVKREDSAARKSLPGEQVMQTPEGTQSRTEQR